MIPVKPLNEIGRKMYTNSVYADAPEVKLFDKPREDESYFSDSDPYYLYSSKERYALLRSGILLYIQHMYGERAVTIPSVDDFLRDHEI